ncbi:MAG: alpha/beta hydrolase [Rhizobiaceae bacterium]
MLRKILIAIIVVVAVGAVIFALGPRIPVDTTVTFDAAAIGADPDAYLAERESRFDDIREGLEKEIVWAYPASRAKTPLAIVYVHGFSSSKGEVRPLPDIVARELAANMFYTRLTGHGRDDDAMAEGTVNAWVNDLAEAVEIGRRIGEKVVVVATSTGGGLTAWGATQPPLLDDVAGLVLISPLFGLKDPMSAMLTWPWGGTLAELVVGEYRSNKPRSELQAKVNTMRYPTRAILPVAAVAGMAHAADYRNVGIPVLFLISDGDRVVRPDLTRQIAKTWGGEAEVVTVEGADDPSQHVIAGDALSPSTTEPLAARAVEWIRKTVR